MHKFLSVLFSVVCVVAFGQTQTVLINKHAFSFKKIAETNENVDVPIQKLEVYQDKKKLLTHTINKTGGDHNSEDVELGGYEIRDSSVTFYSYWARAGDAPVSPFGVRKQLYQVVANGKWILKKAELYIETSRDGWEENKGIKYLFTKSKNEAERKELLAYIRETETEYKASFVFGSSADLLFKEVREKLKTQIQAATKGWKAHYTKNGFGYKM